MHVELRLERTRARRWHQELVAALAALPDTSIEVRWAAASGAEDVRMERLLALERRVHGLVPGRSLQTSARSFAIRQDTAVQADLVIDLTTNRADPAVSPGPATWRLTFDGLPGADNGLSWLASGHSPGVRLVTGDDRVVAEGRPGSENPGVTVTAFEDLLAGCTTLIVQAVAGNPTTLSVTPEPPTTPTQVSALGKGLRVLAGAAAHRGYRALYRAPHWRVGWRFVDGPDMLDLIGHPTSGWNVLPDDGRHFYADPFPFVSDEGQSFIFVEDFEHRVGRGVISVVELDGDGPTGTPRPVLEHDVHLSYPCVFAHDGEIWMVPETSAARTVELYRAVRFPDKWTRERVLLSDLDASDATPFQHEGRWWLTATVRDGGSCSDALHLWHADDLVGPWHPHPRNPVLLDIAAARPAGMVVNREGRLLRPAQDGRGGYGSAVTLTEITRLDPEAFEQQVIGRLTPGSNWPGHRLHTVNRAGGLECIDGSALSPRFRRSLRTDRG